MAGFLKILFRNLLEGPSTDPFPLGETFSPERIRGTVRIDPELCMGCGMCRYSCTAGAIHIRHNEDGSGYTISVWQDSCCLCASCRHYCPTGAITIDDDWHHAHVEADKFGMLEQQTITYEPCSHCGSLIRPIPLPLARKLYAHNTSLDPDVIRHLCPKCRQIEDAKRNACHLPAPGEGRAQDDSVAESASPVKK